MPAVKLAYKDLYSVFILIFVLCPEAPLNFKFCIAPLILDFVWQPAMAWQPFRPVDVHIELRAIHFESTFQPTIPSAALQKFSLLDVCVSLLDLCVFLHLP